MSGMVVRTNIGAMNANRNLNKNNNVVGKSLEKLSSGFKINRAGDDASGLAISEKMKAQIKSLDTASANAEDGISLIQTAEGYLSEVHDMLNRMVELAQKSANGINADSMKRQASAYGIGNVSDVNGQDVSGNLAGTDRAALQAEMDQLAAEIDRIAITANFNGNKLFNGAMDVNTASYLGSDGTENAKAVVGEPLTLQIGETSSYADRLSVNIRRMSTDILFKEMASVTLVGNDGAVTINQNLTIKNARQTNTIARTMLAQQDSVGAVSAGAATTVGALTKGELSTNKLAITLNISDQAYATAVAEGLKNAINDVSSQRADLGAMQNRLDYTINNLNTASENMSAANSRIRDTDMAKEMMKYTSNNVLTQAAQAMLAQANTKTQNVLQLLQ